MNISCDFCDVLNIPDLLDEGHYDIDPSLAGRLVRFYCNNPDTERNYCPHRGLKEQCLFHRMIEINTNTLKK